MNTLSQDIALDHLNRCRSELHARARRLAQLQSSADAFAKRVAKARVLESIASVRNAKAHAREIGALR